MMFRVEKWIEMDAGHRIPTHGSKCRNLHGHRYRVTAVLEAEETQAGEHSESGMVMDFGAVKKALMSAVHDVCDHKTMLWQEDPLVEELDGLAGVDLVLLPVLPTAEELARYWAGVLEVEPAVAALNLSGARLVCVRVHETPTSVAEYWLG